MARKTFTARGMRAYGRLSTFHGVKAESKYKGGGFTVTFSTRQKCKKDATHVSVELEGHGVLAEWFSVDIVPSVENSKVSAEVGFRQHFGIWNGKPHEYAGRMVAFCKCEHEDPWTARKHSGRAPALTNLKRSRKTKAKA